MSFIHTTRGQVSVLALSGIMGLFASFAIPIFWVSDIKASNTIQDNQISALQKNNEEMRMDIKEINLGITALLIKNNIDPARLKK